MSSKKQIKECLICCEKFNKSDHKPSLCQYCNYEACTSCAETYLIGTTQDAHCMNPDCKKAWSYEFMTGIFTKKFITSTYKKRREDLLFERERSLLPETQPYAEVAKRIHDIEKLEDPINQQINKTKDEINKNQIQWSTTTDPQKRLEKYKKLLDLKIKHFTLKTEREFIAYKKNIIMREINGTSIEKEKRVFVRACPADNCKGFLSTAWKCGLCEVRVCAECHEIKETKDQFDARHPKGHNSAASAPAPEHICKPENVQTALVLKNECKNCPKCAASIFKIEGCDQMYCTMCQTAFSWRTGLVETGTIHNPHYYEYLRRQNNGVIPRNLGDIPCGGLPTQYELRNHMRALKISEVDITLIIEIIHRSHSHISIVEVPHYTTNAVVDNRDLRVSYLIQKIDEEKFKHVLQKNEKARNKKQEIRMVLDMLLATIADILRGILTCVTVEEFLIRKDELENLRTYFNSSLAPISKRYNCVAPHITDKWLYLGSYKYA